MTDPKSISRNREYYTDQYGNTRPTTRDNAVGGSYEASVDISDEFGSDIATDPNVPDEYQEFFSDLPPEAGPNDGQLMDGVNEQVDGSIPPGTAPIRWEASQIADEISGLLQENKGLLESAEAYDTFKTQFSKLERSIGRAGIDADALADQLYELKDNLTGAVEEINSNNAEAFDSAIQGMESLKTQVKKSKLPSAQKSELTEKIDDRIENLKKGKREKLVYGEAGKGNTERLEKEVNRAIGMNDLKKGFESVVSKIPNKGWAWQRTVELSRMVRDAVKNGSWSEVNFFLTKLSGNDANNVVQQFVGSLFYGPADKDEDKLNQLLAMIPAETREVMAEVTVAPATYIGGNYQEALSSENVDTSSNREEFMYYGNPTVTADRLRQSDIDDSLDELDQEASSPTLSTDS